MPPTAPYNIVRQRSYTVEFNNSLAGSGLNSTNYLQSNVQIDAVYDFLVVDWTAVVFCDAVVGASIAGMAAGYGGGSTAPTAAGNIFPDISQFRCNVQFGDYWLGDKPFPVSARFGNAEFPYRPDRPQAVKRGQTISMLFYNDTAAGVGFNARGRFTFNGYDVTLNS